MFRVLNLIKHRPFLHNTTRKNNKKIYVFMYVDIKHKNRTLQICLLIYQIHYIYFTSNNIRPIISDANNDMGKF